MEEESVHQSKRMFKYSNKEISKHLSKEQENNNYKKLIKKIFNKKNRNYKK